MVKGGGHDPELEASKGGFLCRDKEAAPEVDEKCPPKEFTVRCFMEVESPAGKRRESMVRLLIPLMKESARESPEARMSATLIADKWKWGASLTRTVA